MRSNKYHDGVPTDHFRKGHGSPELHNVGGHLFHNPRHAGAAALARRFAMKLMAAPTAPGVYVDISAAAPSAAQAPSTGTWFVSGEAEMGPVGVAIPITSMVDYANFLGGRAGYTTLYDSLDEFFRDGGVLAYVSRVVGPSAVKAHLTLVDQAMSPLATLVVTANSPGVWANSSGATVAVADGSADNSYVITIANNVNGQVYTSPDLFTPADAVTWATNLAGTAPWAFPFTITNSGSATAAPNNNPANISATTLASGADDLADLTETQWTNALEAFLPNLGPGQVSAPGHATEDGWQALIAHAGELNGQGALVNNRFALLDDVDTGTASTIISDAIEAQGGDDPSYGMFLAPWVIIPGVPASSPGGSPAAATRTVPPSALVAALMASNDQQNNAGVPAAGPNGQSTYAIGVTHAYDLTDLGSLNTAGVSVIQQISGIVQLYGYVTLSLTPQWVSASFARMRMSLVSQLNAVAAQFAFSQIDGRGQLLSHFNGSLAGVCQQLWQQGALFGDTAADAFSVNTGPQVNTNATLAAGQLNAVVSVRFSPYAEFVIISVVQYTVAQTIPS